VVLPYADFDPATVEPTDPSNQPTGRYRSVDRTGNKTTSFDLGAADTPLIRFAFADYGD